MVSQRYGAGAGVPLEPEPCHRDVHSEHELRRSVCLQRWD